MTYCAAMVMRVLIGEILMMRGRLDVRPNSAPIHAGGRRFRNDERHETDRPVRMRHFLKRDVSDMLFVERIALPRFTQKCTCVLGHETFQMLRHDHRNEFFASHDVSPLKAIMYGNRTKRNINP